jgi:hypothetical protein
MMVPTHPAFRAVLQRDRLMDASASSRPRRRSRLSNLARLPRAVAAVTTAGIVTARAVMNHGSATQPSPSEEVSR